MNNLFRCLLWCSFFIMPGLSKGQFHFDDFTFVKTDTNLYAIAISKHSRLVYTRYFNDKPANELFNDQSLTKSIMSLLIGIAIDHGYISSLDEKISRFFPEIINDPDKRKQEITIRQIMNQASGLSHEDLSRLGDYLSLPDPSGYTLAQPMISNPGGLFHYNNAASHLLSVMLTKATGMPTFDFAKKFLFFPLRIEKIQWMKMNDGYYDGSGLLSIRLSVMDMNTIGQMVLDGGRYKGRQILSAAYVQQLVNPVRTYNTGWGFTGSTYALCWYHKNYQGIPIVYGLGWGGQFNFVLPSLHAVVTVNESVRDATAVQQSNKFLTTIFPLILHELKASDN